MAQKIFWGHYHSRIQKIAKITCSSAITGPIRSGTHCNGGWWNGTNMLRSGRFLWMIGKPNPFDPLLTITSTSDCYTARNTLPIFIIFLKKKSKNDLNLFDKLGCSSCQQQMESDGVVLGMTALLKGKRAHTSLCRRPIKTWKKKGQ